MSKDKLFISNVKIDLESSHFYSKGATNSKTQARTEIQDSAQIIEVNLKTATLQVTRVVKFNPESLFSIECTAKMIMDIDPKTKDTLPTLNEIQTYIQENIVKIVNKTSVFEKMSLLVAQISSFNHAPLILPPVFMTND